MGKKHSIKSLVNSIASVAVHKILVKYTSKPESRKHLEGEIGTYSEEVLNKSEDYSWSRQELDEIKIRAISVTRNKLSNKYPDININDRELKEFVIDTMQELHLIWPTTMKFHKAMKSFIKKSS